MSYLRSGGNWVCVRGDGEGRARYGLSGRKPCGKRKRCPLQAARGGAAPPLRECGAALFGDRPPRPLPRAPAGASGARGAREGRGPAQRTPGVAAERLASSTGGGVTNITLAAPAPCERWVGQGSGVGAWCVAARHRGERAGRPRSRPPAGPGAGRRGNARSSDGPANGAIQCNRGLAARPPQPRPPAPGALRSAAIFLRWAA
jgi:hypothetical protein